MAIPKRDSRCRLVPHVPKPLTVVTARPVYNFADLCKAMQNRERRTLIDSTGDSVRGMVNGITAEDGSGRSWLVTLHDDGVNHEVWVRTL
jgi:hypothetical protein